MKVLAPEEVQRLRTSALPKSERIELYPPRDSVFVGLERRGYVISEPDHSVRINFQHITPLGLSALRYKIGRYLPRWASRINLEIIGVKVERLRDISEEDAKAEGVLPFFERFPDCGKDQRLTSGELAAYYPYRASLAVLWDEINGDRATWKSNPWVWCISFRRIP